MCFPLGIAVLRVNEAPVGKTFPTELKVAIRACGKIVLARRMGKVGRVYHSHVMWKQPFPFTIGMPQFVPGHRLVFCCIHRCVPFNAGSTCPLWLSYCLHVMPWCQATWWEKHMANWHSRHRTGRSSFTSLGSKVCPFPHSPRRHQRKLGSWLVDLSWRSLSYLQLTYVSQKPSGGRRWVINQHTPFFRLRVDIALYLLIRQSSPAPI